MLYYYKPQCWLFFPHDKTIFCLFPANFSASFEIDVFVTTEPISISIMIHSISFSTRNNLVYRHHICLAENSLISLTLLIKPFVNQQISVHCHHRLSDWISFKLKRASSVRIISCSLCNAVYARAACKNNPIDIKFTS